MFRKVMLVLVLAIAAVAQPVFEAGPVAQPASAPSFPSPILGNPSLFLDGTPRPISTWLGAVPSADKTVFIGGVLGLANLTVPANIQQMLATGKIGIYEHGTGMYALTAAQRVALMSAWASTGTLACGGGQGMGEIGPVSTATGQQQPTYTATFGTCMNYPVEVNMNVGTGAGAGTGTYTAASTDAKPGTTYVGYYSPADVASITDAFTEAARHGAKNIAPVVAPNDPNMDFDDPFATGTYWAPVRGFGLAGGGLAFDVPPGYAFDRAPSYLDMLRQMIQWCRANGLRSTVIVSPWALVPDGSGNTASSGFDQHFLSATMRLVDYLMNNDALPSSWVVENYTEIGQGTENQPGLDGTKGTLNEVALFLARSVRTSPTGTTAATVTGVADRGLQSFGLHTTVTADLVAAHIGPLHLADIYGVGTMAAQDSGNVRMTGGDISGATYIHPSTTPLLPNLLLQGGTASAFLSGSAAGGVDIVATGGAPSVLTAGGFSGPVTAGVRAPALLTAGLVIPAGSNSVIMQSPGAGGTTGAVNLSGTTGPISVNLTGGFTADTYTGPVVAGVAQPAKLTTGFVIQAGTNSVIMASPGGVGGTSGVVNLSGTTGSIALNLNGDLTAGTYTGPIVASVAQPAKLTAGLVVQAGTNSVIMASPGGVGGTSGTLKLSGTTGQVAVAIDGSLTVGADPLVPLAVATKQYVDGARAGSALGLTAAGTTQATAYQTTAQASQFTTVAAGAGAVLRSMTPGLAQTVCNDGANPLNIYPPAGGTIQGRAANAAATIAAGTCGTIIQLSATLYHQ